MPHDPARCAVEIVRMLSLGCATQTAAKIMGVAAATTDTHKTNAMDKLGVRKVAFLPRIANKLRICKLNETLTPAERRKLRRKRDGWN